MDSNLPKGWTEVELEQCCDILDSIRVPINGDERAKRQGDVPYYGATGQVGWIDDFLFNEELVLIGEDGAPFYDKSKSISYIVNGKSWVNNHAHVLRAKNVTSNKFINYFLNNFNYNGYVNGTTRLKLTQGKLKEIPILLPPLPEQQRIVEKLDALMARISNSKTRLEKIPTLLKNFRQSVLAAAVSGELTKEWREEKKRKLIAYDKINEPKEIETSDIHQSWIKTKLDNVNSRVSVGHVGPTSKYYTDKEKGIPFLRSQNVRPGRIDFEGLQYITKEFHSSLKKSQLKGGDLLVVRVGANCGDACILPDNLGEINCANIVFARPNDGISKYVGLFFISPSWLKQIDEISTGSAQPVINTAIVAETKVDLPSLEEQKEIVRKVEDFFHFADSIEARYQKAKAWFDKLPQSLLAKAFRGELVPQNEEDEPASELLKRIQQAKQTNLPAGKAGHKPSSKAKRRKMYEDNDELSLVAEE